MLMPAIMPSDWPDCTDWSDASKPSTWISYWKPWSSAMAFSRSMSMPTKLPCASWNSNGAKVVSVAMR